MNVAEFVACVERHAPPSLAFPGDPIGLQLGHPDRPVTKLLVSLDPTLPALEHGLDQGCDAWLVHHPLIYQPIKSLVETTSTAKIAAQAIRADMALIGAHTNWDVAPGGINDVLAELFQLEGVSSWGSGVDEALEKLVTFVPREALETVYDALKAAGAGEIGRYKGCAFTAEGEGRFEAGPGAHPVVGSSSGPNVVPETRLEMVVRASQKSAVTAALRRTHPYEEPAFDWVPLAQKVQHRAGRVGDLRQPLSTVDFQKEIDRVLGCRCDAWFPSDRPVRRVGFVGGAASGDWVWAQAEAIDVFVTGEVRQHDAVGACESGIGIVAAGHYATENPGIMRLGDRVAQELGIPVVKFEPAPGTAGRPR